MYQVFAATGDDSTNIVPGLYTHPITLPYQHQHDILVKMSKRKQLDGREIWTRSTQTAWTPGTP